MTLPQAVAPKAVLPKIVLPTILRRSAGAATLVALLLILFGLAAPMAAAAPAGASPSYVRLAHLSPDTPQVDVYVDSAADPARSFVVPGVGYGVVSDYRPMPADTYVISMRRRGRAGGLAARHLHHGAGPARRGVHRSRAPGGPPSWVSRCSPTSSTCRPPARPACGSSTRR